VHVAAGGTSDTLEYDADELARLRIGVGWRVHNLTTMCWGLVRSVSGDTVQFTANMEPVPPALAAPNSLGDEFVFHPPSGIPGHWADAILYLGPMVHPDYRVSETTMAGEFSVVARGQAHTEFIDGASVIPPNYPVHPYSQDDPHPAHSSRPTLAGATVTLSGVFFGSDLVVLCNGVPSPAVVVISEVEAQADLPPGTTGDVDVRVENASGAGSTWPAAFSV
jgi:hypothetical protein